MRTEFASVFLFASSCLIFAAPVFSEDWAISNARIQTMDSDRTYASAMCVTDGLVTYVGDNTDNCAKSATLLDMEGKLILPGFIDSHMHIFWGSFSDAGVNLTLADSMDKLFAGLQELKRLNPGNEPIFSGGWQNFLFDAQGPRKELLDEIFGDRVVILSSVDSHSEWFSSRALKDAGIDENTIDPMPGTSFWERDKETGEILGTSREAASAEPISALIKRNRETYKERLKHWLPRAAASGLTSVFDAGMTAPTMVDAYEILQELEASGELTLRVFSSVHSEDKSKTSHVDRLIEIKEQFTSEMIRPTAVKIYADGVPEGHTAYMLRGYIDQPSNRSRPFTDPAEMAAIVAEGEAKNQSIHIHAIGDAAVRLTLDTIEKARTQVVVDQRPRHVIAHMDYVDYSDIPRFAAMDVVPQTSIQWATVDPSYETFVSYVGRDIHDRAYPVRSLMETGARQSFGTDWPAAAFLSTYKPLIQLEVATTRRLPGVKEGAMRNPREALEVLRAIEGLTLNAAYQVGAETEIGSLEVGKKADFIVLQDDLFEVAPHTIHQTPVAMTFVGGRLVHEAN